MLSALVGTYHAGIGILPANAPNMVLAGAAETLYRVELIYGTYFLVRFPTWSVIKIAICVALTLLLFPARPERAAGETRHPPVSAAERRLMMILGVALALWATDFLHHIHAGWIALAAAMACILPGIGVLPLEAFNERIRFGPFYYIGAVLGLGGIMTESGLTAAVGERLVQALDLQAGADAVNFGILIAVATTTSLLTTSAAQPALLAPLAGEIAEGIGWSIPAVLTTLAAGYSTVLLPHTVPPIVVGLRVADVPFRAAIRYMIPTAAVGLVVIVPLDYLWWRFLGFFG
jgi:di/tricarboxylate transporter